MFPPELENFGIKNSRIRKKLPILAFRWISYKIIQKNGRKIS
jgi:hypothetical protein